MSDPFDYRWGPVSARDRVSSLVDRAGYVYNFDDIHARLSQVPLVELELEFRRHRNAAFKRSIRRPHAGRQGAGSAG
jgi:hypothetical protein